MANQPNFKKLWERLRSIYEIAGRSKEVVLLDNHADKKELILRKLNVISDMDVNRILDEIRSKGK